MNKTAIEWTDYSWNPIKGICPVGCWYCYARRMYKRFGWPADFRWDGRVPILSNKKPSRIFICSTIEMFHPLIPKEWRDRIFKIIEADYNRKHIFQILTKFPQNIDREMPDNAWLGVTITKSSEMTKWLRLLQIKATIKFISFEPLLKNIKPLPCSPDWIIIGRLTGHGKQCDPNREQIEEMVHHYKAGGTPLFLKDNLKEIWGDGLIQEFPKEKR